MNREHYERIKRDQQYGSAVKFIFRCLQVGIPLSAIDTNDWHSNLEPSVYIHCKENPFLMRKYQRMTEQNVARALNWFRSNGNNHHTIAP